MISFQARYGFYYVNIGCDGDVDFEYLMSVLQRRAAERQDREAPCRTKQTYTGTRRFA